MWDRAVCENRRIVPGENDARIATLRAAAISAAIACYPRYSGFAVAAAVERVDGEAYGGANVEVVNFSLTKHAEEVAVVAAMLDGALSLGDQWLAAVYTRDVPPCGSCRQFLWEWAAPGAICFVDRSASGGGVREVPLAALMPEPFEPAVLPDRRPT
jgi:cytidine deaminase